MGSPRARDDVELANCSLRSLKYPGFEIPSLKDRLSLRVGDRVKVVVVRVGRTDVGERIWLEVTGPFGFCGWLGTILSFPLTSGLRHGDVLEFVVENVCDVQGAPVDEIVRSAT